jgi:predicted transcriptional regulator
MDEDEEPEEDKLTLEDLDDRLKDAEAIIDQLETNVGTLQEGYDRLWQAMKDAGLLV